MPTDHNKFNDVTHANFISEWKSNLSIEDTDDTLAKMLSVLSSIEDSFPKEQLIFLYKVGDFKPIYTSPSIENILGYTQSEYLSLGYKSHMPPQNHSDFDYLRELIVCLKEINKNYKINNFTSKRADIFIFGRQLRTKRGDIKHFLVSYSYKTAEDSKLPNYALIYFHLIDHLMNAIPTFWFYSKAATNSTKKMAHFYKYNEIRYCKNKLITKREREVLSHIAMRKSSKEVAQILNLSSETIDKHRKNAMNRLGVKDTTALIQILHICDEL